MRLHRWHAVLLEWDSKLAISCSYIEKKAIFLICKFLQNFTSLSYLLRVARKKLY